MQRWRNQVLDPELGNSFNIITDFVVAEGD